MSFLQPIAGLVAGVLGAAALLLFYFLKLRRRPIRVGSTLLWQRAAEDMEVNQPFQWLRANWLLVLQMLAVLLLAAALGRPAIEGGGESADRLIILIDRSASMSVRDADGGRSRLEAARERARELSETATRSGETDVLVAAYGATTRVLEGWTRSRGRLNRAIGSITPSDQPDRLASAVELMRPMLTGEGLEDGSRSARVVVLTDTAASVPGMGTAETSVEVFGGAVPAENVGIVAVGARRDFDRPELIRVFARVAMNIPSGGVVAVELRRDGEAIDRRAIEVPGATEQSLGSAGVSFEVESASEAELTLALRRADALMADNEASVLVPSLKQPAVALVTPEAPGRDPVDWVTRDVLEALGPETLVTVSAAQYERDPASVLGRVSWVVFDRVEPVAVPPIPSLSLGASLPTPELSTDGPTGATRVLSWKRDHPVVSTARMDRLRVDSTIGLRVEGVVGDGVAGTLGVIRELARGRTGPLVLETESAGVRRLIVGFEPALSSWPLDVGYAVFLATAAERLTFSGETGAGRFSTSAKSAVVRAAGGAAYANAEGIELRAQAASGTGEVTELDLGVPERVGVYRSGGGGVVAVNLVDERETAIRVGTAQAGDGGGGRRAAALSGRREIWAWFVLGALAVVTAEWIVYLARARRTIAGGAA